MLAFCRHMLGSAPEAEDAVQETFASAFRALGNDSRDVELRPWLYAIARNRCLSVLRSRRPTLELEEMGGDPESLPELVARREDLRSLVEDVRRLPAQQRAALLLSELADMPHRELAIVLQCRTEKVKALVFQARSTLIAEREARSTSCREVREALAGEGLAGAERASLRRHLRGCDGCSEFSEDVRRQRVALALALPVIPSAALKAQTLAAALSGANGLAAGAGGAAGGSYGTSVVGGVGKAVIAKALIAIGLIGAAGASTVAITTHASGGHSSTNGTHHARSHRAASVSGGQQGTRVRAAAKAGPRGRNHGLSHGAAVRRTAAGLTGAAAAPDAIGSAGHGHLAPGVLNGAANSGHATGKTNAAANANGNAYGLSGGHRRAQGSAPNRSNSTSHSQGAQHSATAGGGSQVPATSGHTQTGSSTTPTTTGQTHTSAATVPVMPSTTGVQQRTAPAPRPALPAPAAAVVQVVRA